MFYSVEGNRSSSAIVGTETPNISFLKQDQFVLLMCHQCCLSSLVSSVERPLVFRYRYILLSSDVICSKSVLIKQSVRKI